MAKRKKGMTFIPYDYEAAYNKSLEDMHEFFVEQMFKQGKKVVYALKEIRAGDQFEVEIYPQFKKMDEVPPEGRSIKKDNDKAQRNLNDKNARKYVERLINENFTDRDLWLTFTYDNEHLPPDGDIDAAIKNVQKFIRRVRYDLVVALIEKESGYKFDKVGDDGHSIGYMQIYEECHRDRMERLNVTDLTNPYQNVLVGIDYLSELIERYGTIQDALAAYNYGEQGAKQHLWKNGIYVYEYNQTIMSRMKEIEEELEQDAGD